MFDFITQHQSWAALLIYWIFSAAVSSMPEPAANSAAGYLWLYRFCHTTAGNLTTAFGNKLPGLKTIILGLTIPLLFMAPACAARYTIHPGALSTADSVGYDALLIAQAAIDQAKIEFQGKPNEALNTLIRSYNVARESWLTYRGALAAQLPSGDYYNQLNKNLTDLTNAIRALKEAK